MKKGTFYIYGFFVENLNEPIPKEVTGYTVNIDGLNLGLHRWDKSGNWIVSELSTGVKIIEGRTRKEAIERAKPYLQQTKELISTRERLKKAREVIKAAYAA